MIPKLPPDALYIRWGRFQAAAQGRLALVVVVIIAMTLLIVSLR
jgi:hypothetical protein